MAGQHHHEAAPSGGVISAGGRIADPAYQISVPHKRDHFWWHACGRISRAQMKRLYGERSAATKCAQPDAEEADPSGGCTRNLLGPSRRRSSDHSRDPIGMAARRTCQVLGQRRLVRRKVTAGQADAAELTSDIIRPGRSGCRPIAGLLNGSGTAGTAARGAGVRHRPQRSRLWRTAPASGSSKSGRAT